VNPPKGRDGHVSFRLEFRFSLNFRFDHARSLSLVDPLFQRAFSLPPNKVLFLPTPQSQSGFQRSAWKLSFCCRAVIPPATYPSSALGRFFQFSLVPRSTPFRFVGRDGLPSAPAGIVLLPASCRILLFRLAPRTFPSTLYFDWRCTYPVDRSCLPEGLTFGSLPASYRDFFVLFPLSFCNICTARLLTTESSL